MVEFGSCMDTGKVREVVSKKEEGKSNEEMHHDMPLRLASVGAFTGGAWHSMDTLLARLWVVWPGSR